MSDLSGKTAYLKGLAEGMKIAEKSDEGSVISKIIDVLTDMSQSIAKLSERCDGADNELKLIGESVTDMGISIDDLYECLDDDYLDDDYYDDDDDGLFEIMCPECGEDVVVDYDMLDDENNIVCPNCHKEIELDFDEDTEEFGEIDD